MFSSVPRQQGVALQAEAVETLAQASDGYRTLDGWISRLALEGRLKHKQDHWGVGQSAPRAGQRRLPLHVPAPLSSILTRSPRSWPTKLSSPRRS